MPPRGGKPERKVHPGWKKLDERPPIVHEDLSRIIVLAQDLQFYRTVDDDGGLGAAAWIELRDAVNRLPEKEEI
jgi:hypothetical protein